MAYRFVHSADIHLDSPLRSLALRDGDLAERIGSATRRSFSRIVDLCLDERVDALLLAGDLYDGDQTSMKTARFLAAEMRRLDEAGIRTFLIRGNHDALSRITKELTFPDSVTVFGGRADAVRLDRPEHGFDVAIHGMSFAQPHAPESLLPRYKVPVAGAVNIALMHTSLTGAAGHDLYAPCNVLDLAAAGFDYWALGHVHKRMVAPGTAAIVMPGMPQGRDINEAGAKSVTLVTIGDDRAVSMEERFVSVAEFQRVAVDLTGVEEWRDMVARVDAALGRAREAAISEHLVARLRLTGSTPLAWRLRRDPDLLKAEADDRAAAIGASSVETIELDARPPVAADGVSADPLAELGELIQGEVAGSARFAAAAARIVEELRGQLPVECRALFGQDEAGAADVIALLAREGGEDVLAWLQARPEPSVSDG